MPGWLAPDGGGLSDVDYLTAQVQLSFETPATYTNPLAVETELQCRYHRREAQFEEFEDARGAATVQQWLELNVNPELGPSFTVEDFAPSTAGVYGTIQIDLQGRTRLFSVTGVTLETPNLRLHLGDEREP